MLRSTRWTNAGRIGAILAAATAILPAQNAAVATLTGKVATTDGKAVAGALVQVDTGRGVKEARTDASGHYLVPALVPGTVTVKVTARDLQAFRTSVTAVAAQSLTLNVRLQPVSGATVEIVAAAPVTVGVDPTVAITGKNITAEELKTLPAIGNPYDAFLKTMPGVPVGGYNFHNSEDGANGYTVNGVESRSAKGGVQALNINRDLIDQISVLSGGVSAKYGRFVGAAINTVTKSGTNEWQGSMRHDLTSAGWNALPKLAPFVSSAKVPQKVSDTQSYTFLGPIIPDTLFFAAGYQTVTPSRTTIISGNVRSALFPNYTFPQTSTNNLTDLKVDWQINRDHRLSVAWNKYVSFRDAPTSGAGIATLQAGNGPSRSQNGMKSLTYTATLASNLLLDALVSETVLRSGGPGTGPMGGNNVVSWIDKSTLGNGDRYDNGAGSDFSNLERMRTLGVNLSWYQGPHTLTGGLQYYGSRINSRGSSDSLGNSVTPSLALIWFNGWDTAPASMDRQYRKLSTGTTTNSRLTVFSPLVGRFDTNVWGLYVNDVWTLDSHWWFNLGARFDRNSFLSSPEGYTYSASTFVPRLSANYDWQGNQKHVFTLSLAEYAGQLNSGVFTGISVANQSPSAYYAYYGAGHGNDALNADGSINWNVWGNSPTQLGQAYPVVAAVNPLTTRTSFVENSVKPPRAREANLGYKYTDAVQSLSAILLHRIQDNYVGLKHVGAPGLGVGKATKVYWNDPGMESRYENIEVQYRRQFTPAFAAGGNVTWSYTRANAGQGVQYGGRNQWGEFIPNDVVQPFGPEPGQWSSSTTPFTSHLDASYKLGLGRFGNLTSTILGHYTSRSFSGYRTFYGPTDPIVQNHGYASSVGRVYADSPLWWPEQYRFDFQLNYEVQAYKKVKFFATLDVTNLFNHFTGMYKMFSTAITDGTTTYTSANSSSLPAGWYNNPAFRAVAYNGGSYPDGTVGQYIDPRMIQLRLGLRF